LDPSESFVTEVSFKPTSSGRLAMELRSQLMDLTLGPSPVTYSGNDDHPASRSDTIPVFPAVSLRLDAFVVLLKSYPIFSNATEMSFAIREKKSLIVTAGLSTEPHRPTCLPSRTPRLSPRRRHREWCSASCVLEHLRTQKTAEELQKG
jgi:hypothetical protein